jgi:hypothetical protein
VNANGSISFDPSGSNQKMVNSIVANVGMGDGIQFFPIEAGGSSNNVDHIVYHNISGDNHAANAQWSFTNEIEQNPLFVAPGSDNYRLQSGSPAIGYTDTAYSPAYDLEGNVRPAGSEDAGAFEFTGT